jgi:hypothetical protein
MVAEDARRTVPAELDLSPAQRERLGLADHESVRVLASGARTILLERSCSGTGTPLPFDRDLVLTADVRAFSLADLLRLVNGPAKSGFLHFEHGETEKSVYLHAGEVVFASSNQRIDRLGECLVRRGVISSEQHRETQAAYRPPAPFGRYLVDKGFLSPQDVWEGVKLQVEEIVRSLFAFSSGTMLFFEGEVRPDNVVRLALPTERLIAEGLEQRDQLLEFLALLEARHTLLLPVEGAAGKLAGTERAILAALATETAFSTVCRRVGIDPLSGARTVQLLDQMGALRITRDRETGWVEREVRNPDEESLRESVRAHVKLLGELAAPIVAVEGPDALRDRMIQVAQEAAPRHPELLAALDWGPGGVLDPELLIARALRIPGNREREVRTALGELVSYVEFELLNHPKIEDPASFLEGVEEMRARL